MMKRMVRTSLCVSSLSLLLLCSSDILHAQYSDNVDVIIDGYKFSTTQDTTDYTTELTMSSGGRTIETREYPGRISRIEGYDLDNDGQTEILIDVYSGGAHCCTTMEAYRIEDGKLQLIDTIFWGNSGYQVKDIDGTGKYVIYGGSDMFAYAFTNYAETRFVTVIYALEDNKFVNVTSKYPGPVNEYLVNLLEQLSELLSKGFKCEKEGADTFNTESGSMKTLLAAIVATYHSIGETDRGYKLVDTTYICPDKQGFINTLKNEYKLY